MGQKWALEAKNGSMGHKWPQRPKMVQISLMAPKTKNGSMGQKWALDAKNGHKWQKGQKWP